MDHLFRGSDDTCFRDLQRRFVRSCHEIPLGPFYVLRKWYDRPICYSLLIAATQFWDPSSHLFRFGIDELCPTYEEFSSLLQFRTDIPMAVPDDSCHQLRPTLASFLGVSVSTAGTFVQSGMIDLSAVMQYYLTRDARGITTLASGRRKALLLIYFADMLLVCHPRLADPNILQVIDRSWRLGHSPIPVILAETLIGLDDLAGQELANFKGFFYGSPRLLYIWLCERFGFVSRASLDPLYTSSEFFYRENLLHLDTSLEELARFLAFSARSIRWDIPWWRLRTMVVGLSGEGYIRLRGLRRGSFYFPRRLYRQFNMPQIQAPMPTNFDSNVGILTVRERATRQRIWDSRVTRTLERDDLGITRPMLVAVVRSRATMLLETRGDDPLQMQWFYDLGAGLEASAEALIEVYRAMDAARIAEAARDPVWVGLY